MTMSYKYMIHTCEKRKWYVNKNLIPSMLEQGITKDQIIVAVDNDEIGVLFSTMQMFDWIGRTQDWSGIMWHLQDDVLLSSNFKRMTDNLYGDIICGFCSEYDRSKKFGLVEKQDMWYSFPCIGIKNYYAKECADWFFEEAMFRRENKERVEAGKYMDLLFKDFIAQCKKPVRVFNSNPNLVEHVDWLIGGSITNPQRLQKRIQSYYWREPRLTQELSQKLQSSNDKNIT